MLFTYFAYYTALLTIVLSQSNAAHLTPVAVRVAVRSGAVLSTGHTVTRLLPKACHGFTAKVFKSSSVT